MVSVWTDTATAVLGAGCMKFVTLFLKTENVHLLKDVGMIPYFLHKNYGWDCSVATYQNSPEYPYLTDEVRGLRLDFIKRTRLGKIVDGIRYLKAHAAEIDVLNLYHLNLSTYFYELAFRKYNQSGKIYLKLDMNPVGLKTCLAKDLRGLIKRASIRRADIVSVETTVLQKELIKHFGQKIIYITNGYFDRTTSSQDGKALPFEKENVILTVGNLGTKEKATDVLLAAFAKSAPYHDWTLKLIGPVAEQFKPQITDFYEQYPQLKEQVQFLGSIHDKERLMNEYRRAKVFALPSRSESFGIVLVEAASQGCYLVTTDMVPAGYDVNGNGRFGLVVPANDIDALSKALENLFTVNRNWNNDAEKIAAHAKEAFCWNTIIERLYQAISAHF